MLEIFKSGAKNATVVDLNGSIALDPQSDYAIAFKLAGNDPHALSNCQIFFDLVDENDIACFGRNLTNGISASVRNNVLFGRILLTNVELKLLTKTNYIYRLSFTNHGNHQEILTQGNVILTAALQSKTEEIITLKPKATNPKSAKGEQ